MNEVVLPELSYVVTMNRRGIRRRKVSAKNIKMFHIRPDDLGHDFENEFAHLAWGVDFGLAAPSTVALPMYTLIDRYGVMGQGNASKWRCKARLVDGTEWQWLSEEEARDSFTPLQLDVSRGRETCHGVDFRAMPTSTLSRKEIDGIDGEHALKKYRVGTVI